MILRRIAIGLLMFILCFNTISCMQQNSSKKVNKSYASSSNDSAGCWDSIKAKARELTMLFDKAINGGSDNKKRFYMSFPETFKEFHEIYGYDGENYHVLYEQSYSHINLF
jgi:hypothetical protein